MAKKGAEKKIREGNDKKWKNTFARFFERFDLREEKKLATLGRRAIFIFSIVLQALVYLQLFSTPKSEGFFVKLIIFSAAVGVFDLVEALNLFVVKNNRWKVVCYIFEIFALATMLAATGNSYLCILYMFALTDFYMSAKRARSIILTFAFSLPVYVVVNWLALTIFFGRSVSYMYAVTNSVGALLLLVAHFFLINFSLGFYRQYLRLAKALKDLDESQSELKKAYEELAVAAAIEERQRIAKEIHDTAGHSITTVIMQTEAAKLIVEEDPQEAKKRLVAANLQAKHALEELRGSVHLLSGRGETESLKAALEQIVRESTDGTDLKIRSAIEDIETNTETRRFLCNSLKEGISNGIRHGRANAFWLEVKRTDGGIGFLLSDNGVGVDTARMKAGFGLSGMSEHAKRLGGETEFFSEDGEGFEIRIRIPEEQENE